MSRAVLKFDAEAVGRLMTHASESTEWQHSPFEEGEPRPALMLVKDDGIYVMSNGLPRMEQGSNVVYARNYDPRKGDVWDRCREAVGGDDFAEYIELAELGPLPEGACDLVIHISAKDFTVGWEVVVPSNGHPVGQDDHDTATPTQPTQGGNMAGKPTRPPQTSASEIHPGGASRIAGQRAEKHSAAVERAKNPGEPKELEHAPDATFADVLGAAAAAPASDAEIAAMSPVDRINAAHREYEALSEWTKGGEQGERPPTPIRDWDTRKSAEAGTSAEKGEGDMPKNSSNGNGKTPNRARVSSALPQTVRFTVDGKQVGETQNRLSSVARVTATDKAPRWTAGTFRQWIIDQGVADPLRSEWELTLPNGRKVGAVFSSPVAAAEAAKTAAPKKAAPAAKDGPAKTPKTAAAKKAAPAKSASKRPTTRAGRKEASERRLAAAAK